MTDLSLQWTGRLHMALHNSGARVGLPGWKPVHMERVDGAVEIMTDVRTLRVPAPDRWLHYRWGWAPRVARLFGHFGVDTKISLESGDQVVDIGANVGEFSLGATARGAHVLALEGDPAVFACLAANVAQSAITARQALVWKEPTELTFYSAPAKADSSVFQPSKAQAVTELRLPAEPLDQLADGLDRIDLIKCDAEGAEPEVLDGGEKTLARVRQIALDTGPERQGAETSDACEKILTQHGFVVSHSTKGRKITFGVRQ